MQVWRQAASYDELRGSPMAWMLTIARSRAIDRLRSGRQELLLRDSFEGFEENAKSEIDIEETAAIAEVQLRVRDALETLPAEQREVIEMAYYGGLSNLQSPETLDISFKIRGTAVNKVIVKLALHEKCFLQLFASALRSNPDQGLLAPFQPFAATMIIMLHAIAAKVGADLSQDHQLKALSEETKPERLIEQIEARENN